MSDEDFQLLLSMAEEAENAEDAIGTGCDVGENNHFEDLHANSAIAPEAPGCLMDEEEDEDFNLLLEMAAQAEAAAESDQDKLPARTSPAASEAEAPKAVDLPPRAPGTKRKASASPPALKRARSNSDDEHKASPVPVMADAGSKPEHDRPPSAAFQPVSGKYGKGATEHIMPKYAKGPSTEKLVEKHSGLRMKNPVFPSIIFGERLSHLQFLRLHRARERVNAAEGAGPWATVGVLVEKSKPRTSAKGSMYSLWKLSDLDGLTITMFLFGDAHQEHFRESEGSVVAIFNAGAEADMKVGVTLKVNEASSILKLATSSDFALCGSRKKDGSRCRNPVNISRCRFCDYHVQTESRRINSSRGVLQDSSHAARLNTQAEQAAQRQKKPHFAQYIPKQMTEQELAAHAVSYNSQGARHILALAQTAAQENSPQVASAQRLGSVPPKGRKGQDSCRELPAYTGSQQALPRARQQLSQVTITVPRTAGVDPARPARTPLPQQQPPRATRPVTTAVDRPANDNAKQSSSMQPAGPARGSRARRPVPSSGSSMAAGTEKMAARGVPGGRPHAPGGIGMQGSSSAAALAAPPLARGPVRSAGRGPAQAEQKEAGFVVLEEADIEWDAADVAAVKRHTGGDSHAQRVDRASSPEGDNEEGGLFCHTRQSGSHPANEAAERARAEAMRKAVEHVRECGGVEAAMKAAKKDRQAAAVTKGDQHIAEASDAALQQSAPSAGPTIAPSTSGTGPTPKPAGRPASNFYGNATPAAKAHQGSAAASGSQVKASAVKSGTRASIESKLGMRPKRSVKTAGSSAGRAKPMIVPPGTSAFAAAFGAALTEEDRRNVGTRYKQIVDDEEADKVDRLLGSMQKKDELQQRTETITQLSVSAWHCTACDIITERRKLSCQEHVGKRVSATKRWWTCSGCNNRFTTVVVKYPTKRCPNPRCTAPNSEFKKSSMGRAPKTAAGADAPIAAREHFQPRGKEHGFTLNC